MSLCESTVRVEQAAAVVAGAETVETTIAGVGTARIDSDRNRSIGNESGSGSGTSHL